MLCSILRDINNIVRKSIERISNQRINPISAGVVSLRICYFWIGYVGTTWWYSENDWLQSDCALLRIAKAWNEYGCQLGQSGIICLYSLYSKRTYI